jgi:hypothetical protein
MSQMYGEKRIPDKISDFSLKVRVMIDNRHTARTAVHYKPPSNVITFPGNKGKASSTRSRLYLEACQQLLRPVREFFYEDGEGGSGGFSVYDLDGYLGELGEIQGQYTDPAAAEQLDQQERNNLEADVANLQSAGFEYTSENYPEVVAAYGDQLTDRHLPANYADITENSEIRSELKKAYADVKGMIEQAKKSVSSSPVASLTR